MTFARAKVTLKHTKKTAPGAAATATEGLTVSPEQAEDRLMTNLSSTSADGEDEGAS